MIRHGGSQPVEEAPRLPLVRGSKRDCQRLHECTEPFGAIPAKHHNQFEVTHRETGRSLWKPAGRLLEICAPVRYSREAIVSAVDQQGATEAARLNRVSSPA